MSARRGGSPPKSLLLLAALGAACAPVLPAPATAASPLVIASGEFDLPAANAFGEPGFHAAYSFTHEIPTTLDIPTGTQIAISLWDASRPDQTCNREHPLSGCATVDWSDAESRPNVPPGGVFDNSLTFDLGSGPHTFFLSETGALNDVPNAHDPG